MTISSACLQGAERTTANRKRPPDPRRETNNQDISCMRDVVVERGNNARTLRKCGPAPRRWGLWAPSPSHTGVSGLPPLGAIPTLVREYLLEASGSWASVSSGCQPGVRVVPTWSVIGRRHCSRSAIAPLSVIGPWVVALLSQVTLFQRGSASTLTSSFHQAQESAISHFLSELPRFRQ